MSTMPDLTGKRVAVLVEKLYIPAEIDAYQRHFGGMGAKVHLLIRMTYGNWEHPHDVLELPGDVLSDLEPDQGSNRLPTSVQLHTIKVPKVAESDGGRDFPGDLTKANVNDYAAILVAANYTSVRARYFTKDDQGGAPDSAAARKSPSVQFMARAMANAAIVKGALCHGLWALTPMPELLKDRRVTCHEVLRADVQNAGAIYTPGVNGVVVDGDLVTGYSRHQATDPIPPEACMPPYIKAIAEQIGALSGKASPPAA